MTSTCAEPPRADAKPIPLTGLASRQYLCGASLRLSVRLSPCEQPGAASDSLAHPATACPDGRVSPRLVAGRPRRWRVRGDARADAWWGATRAPHQNGVG